MISYVKKYWIYALLTPVFMLGEVSMDLIQPRLMSQIIDEGVLGMSNQGIGNLNQILTVGVWMIGTVILGGIFGILSGVFANLCSQNFGNDIRKDCFRRIMSLSFEQTDAFSTGSLITRVTNDVTQVQNLVTQLLRGCVRTLLLFLGGIFCMMSLDISFGVAVLCALPFVSICVFYFLKAASPNFRMLQKSLDGVNNVMQENVSGARVVKAYVREQYEQERFKTANDQLVQVQMKVLKLFAFMTPLTNIILNITIVAVIKIGAIHVQAGGTTPGQVMAAITYISQIMHSVMMVAMIFQTVSRGNASAKRLQEVLDCCPVIADATENVEPARMGKIEFRNVSFAYPNSSQKEVLKNINLTIAPGETLGILGGTGCGKSSLVQLIPRFYDATVGQVLVDDVDVKNYQLEDLRDRIAITLQKSELFSATIEENIRWGDESATIEEVKQAAKIAQADDFISRQPQQYETVVAEQGMSLSGGQKQRVAISRALLKKAEILILDDSTSALDLKTESKIMQALREQYRDMTKIIIAQRITSVMHADRIAVIENGQIAACGSHETLMKDCEIYQDIYYSQLGEGGVANAAR